MNELSKQSLTSALRPPPGSTNSGGNGCRFFPLGGLRREFATALKAALVTSFLATNILSVLRLPYLLPVPLSVPGEPDLDNRLTLLS